MSSIFARSFGQEQPMKHLRTCPTCGHEHRVSEDRLGGKLKCAECESIFVLSPAEAMAEGVAPPRKAAEKAATSRFAGWTTLVDPNVAAEGAIPGAIGGVLAGVVGAILVGLLARQDGGAIFGTALVGFVGGFAVGAVVGGLVALVGRRLSSDFSMGGTWTLTLCGAVIGALVAVLVDGMRWIPLGMVLGAISIHLWPLLSRRVEAAVDLSDPDETNDSAAGSENARTGNRRRPAAKSSRYAAE
jgi:predicted lipid-binding transport protein (Tim44 family)